jgi:hypothetical protein
VLHLGCGGRQDVFNKIGENPFAHGASGGCSTQNAETAELLTVNSTEGVFTARQYC